MRDHSGCEKGFVQLSRAWYGPANLTDPDVLDRVTVGMYANDGGTTGEFSFIWEKVGHKFGCKLEAWGDSWSALLRFDQLLGEMALLDVAGDNEIDPNEFCAMLRVLGIRDMTPTVNPYAAPDDLRHEAEQRALAAGLSPSDIAALRS